MSDTARAVLLGVFMFASCVWVGGYVAIAVVTRTAVRTLEPAQRITFFRSLGRSYLLVSAPALVVALGTGAALAGEHAWDGTLAAAVVLAAALVASLAVGVVQARRCWRPDTAQHDWGRYSMTYVIGEPCIDVLDRACVEECPVDCIYEGGRSLYIHPDECVDCGACEPVCPVEAIYYEDDLPDKWSVFTADNARFFSEPLPARIARRRGPARPARRRHRTGEQLLGPGRHLRELISHSDAPFQIALAAQLARMEGADPIREV